MIIVGFFVPMFAIAQDSTDMAQMMEPPAQMKEIAKHLPGTWEGELTMSEMDGSKMKVKANFTAGMVLGGRFAQEMHTYDFMGVKMAGMLLLTYDETMEKWVSWWFDQTSATGMRMVETAQKEGESLEMTSDPTPMPGMEEPTVMRYTLSHKGTDEMGMKLEMKMPDDTWFTLMEGTYKKK
ncbi:MAG: DUF1579 family protein [Fimbriimonadaceae bacterium]|nr:DUF1579 family protein [Fimbriimonadaceae bacterium]QYK54725.1 MAG: DUF1579 family protein [Fimbriimonadaceae bacterium]